MLAELAAAVRDRRVSSEELVGRSLERIERLDEPMNAVVAVRADEALADARALDERVASGSEELGPLAGLPLLVKDNEDVTGMRTTHGSLLFEDAPPATADCETVARLRAAGAIVVGKTALPELAFEGFTAGKLFGVTHNPWAPEWSPGGSSGGSGAALVMGLAPLVTGGDGGGSIRIPAAFCGFVGLKPTNGLIGRSPIPSWIDLSTKGPMATSVADVRLLLEVLAGPVHGDPTALPSWSPRPDVRPGKIVAAPRLLPYGPLPEGVAASFERAVDDLASVTGLAAEHRDAVMPDTVSDDDWFLLCAVDELDWVGRDRVERSWDRLGHVAGALRFAMDVPLDGYLAARRRRFAHTRLLDDLLGDDGVLATPTMCVEGLPADGRMPGADEPGTSSADYNTQLQNLTGHPAISLPAGTSANGVPFGLQITGPRFADDLLLSIAERWETARPWPIAAPGYEPFWT